MPLYDFICSEGHPFERFVRLEHFDVEQRCHCGAVASRRVTAPRINRDYSDYDCPITGKIISGKTAHRENLARHGCRILEPGEKEAADNFRRSQERQLDTQIEETVERFYDALPGDKRERLANELTAGVDAQITRSTPQ